MAPPIILKIVAGEGYLAILDESADRIISGGDDIRNEREARRYVEVYARERGLTVNSVLTKEGHIDRFELRRPVTLTLTVSPEAAEMIDSLSRELGMTKDALIAKAIVLMKVAADALKEGKAFGVASSPESLEVEVVGLGPNRR